MSLENNPVGVRKLADAKKLIARDDASKVESAIEFMKGDHWQQSKGWSGPIPQQNSADYTLVASEIEKGFVSKNVIKEVTDRAVNGVVGREPKIVLTHKDKRNVKLIKEAEETLAQFFKDKDVLKEVQKALRNSFVAGKSTLRLFIPNGLMNNGVVEINEKDPLSFLYVDAPDALSSGVVTEDSTKEKAGIYIGKYTDASGKEIEVAEVTYLLPIESESGKRFTEITTIPEKGQGETAQLDLNGKLMIYELGMPALITDSVLSQQKMLNLNLTMMQRNSVLGGYLERVILNGQLPGHYEEINGEQVFVREDFITGAGTINAINGVPQFDENGNVASYSNASISYRDPVSVKTFLESKQASYEAILEETQQLHALISGDATASGDSRRMAISSFVSSLRIPKYTTERALEWLAETVLAFAGVFSGNPDKFKDITAKAECKLDTGAVSAGEIDLLERQVRIGIISIETAREKSGIENNAEEQARVEAEVAFKESVLNAYKENDLMPSTLDSTLDNRDIVANGAEE